MQSREQEIISYFERYHEVTGLAFATIGTRANNDSRLYDRLKFDEGSCGSKVYKKIVEWFTANMPANDVPHEEIHKQPSKKLIKKRKT